jgi:hypothetical protein
MPQSISVIIVEKTGVLKSYNIKDYKEEDLYKKCGFKKAEGFQKQNEWTVKLESQKYVISLYGKLDGKANTENKYDFPPPADNKLFFGSCLLFCMTKDDKNNKSFYNLTIPIWNKLYEKLFGGFEDLTVAGMEDEEEEDELDNIPKSKKTKAGGYLKDGFVVDDEEDEEDEEDNDDEDESICADDDEIPVNNGEQEDQLELEDIGSELSEESYDYSDSDSEDSEDSEDSD